MIDDERAGDELQVTSTGDAGVGVAMRDQKLATALDALRAHDGAFLVCLVNSGENRSTFELHAHYDAPGLLVPEGRDREEYAAEIEPALRWAFLQFCTDRLAEAAE